MVEGCVLIFSSENSKLQFTSDQPSTGECWIPPNNDTPCPKQRSSTNKIVGGAKSQLESNPIPSRGAQRASAKACAHQDPETPQRLSQTCLWVSECLLQRYGSAVACLRDRGYGYSRAGSHSVWHKPSWRRSPLTSPQSHRADDQQMVEQLYQVNWLCGS